MSLVINSINASSNRAKRTRNRNESEIAKVLASLDVGKEVTFDIAIEYNSDEVAMFEARNEKIETLELALESDSINDATKANVALAIQALNGDAKEMDRVAFNREVSKIRSMTYHVPIRHKWIGSKLSMNVSLDTLQVHVARILGSRKVRGSSQSTSIVDVDSILESLPKSE